MRGSGCQVPTYDSRRARADRRWSIARRVVTVAYLESHSWDDYAEWFRGLTEGPTEETKARYAFVYGDFRRLRRSGLIACQYRAAEWLHKGRRAGGSRSPAASRRHVSVNAARRGAPRWGS
jgi:hypothetical protein